jgi:hypothetical protein
MVLEHPGLIRHPEKTANILDHVLRPINKIFESKLEKLIVLQIRFQRAPFVEQRDPLTSRRPRIAVPPKLHPRGGDIPPVADQVEKLGVRP